MEHPYRTMDRPEDVVETRLQALESASEALTARHRVSTCALIALALVFVATVSGHATSSFSRKREEACGDSVRTVWVGAPTTADDLTPKPIYSTCLSGQASSSEYHGDWLVLRCTCRANVTALAP